MKQAFYNFNSNNNYKILFLTIARKIGLQHPQTATQATKGLRVSICSWFLGVRKFAMQLFLLKGPFTQFFRKANTCSSFIKTFSIPLSKLTLKPQLHRKQQNSLHWQQRYFLIVFPSSNNRSNWLSTQMVIYMCLDKASLLIKN